jgi:ABC-2 type transport system permease protein
MRRWDYFLGKLGVIGGFLVATMIGPPVLAWVLGVGFSLDFGVLRETLPLLGASVVYGGVFVVSAGTLMLAISSLSKNSRHVVILWLGLWWVSNMLAGTLTLVLDKDWCPLVSYTSNLDRVCHEMLGTEKAWKQLGKLAGIQPAPPPPPGVSPRMARRLQRPPWLVAEEYPWTWSAGALLGWLGVSIGVLSLRVKTLDKLK